MKLRFLIIHSFWDRANFAWSKLLEIFEISPEVESVCCLYSAYATYVIFYAEMIIPCKKKKKKKWKKIIFLSTSCEDPKLWRLTQNSLNTFTYIGINSNSSLVAQVLTVSEISLRQCFLTWDRKRTIGNRFWKKRWGGILINNNNNQIRPRYE